MSPAGRIDEFALPHPRSRPNGIVAGADGDLWFTELGSQRIGRMTPDGDLTEFALPAAGLPMGIAAGPDGNIWVTVAEAHAICKIGPDGVASAFFLPDNVYPSFIASGPDHNLWFTEPDGRIGRLTLTGQLTQFAATPAGDAADPTGARKHQLLIAPQ
jgi:virginiamycin B lyase